MGKPSSNAHAMSVDLRPYPRYYQNKFLAAEFLQAGPQNNKKSKSTR